jgi:hypothetical protein
VIFKINATAEEGTYKLSHSLGSIARPREAARRRRCVVECIMNYRVIFGRCALRREDARTSQLLGDGMR